MAVAKKSIVAKVPAKVSGKPTVKSPDHGKTTNTGSQKAYDKANEENASYYGGGEHKGRGTGFDGGAPAKPKKMR